MVPVLNSGAGLSDSVLLGRVRTCISNRFPGAAWGLHFDTLCTSGLGISRSQAASLHGSMGNRIQGAWRKWPAYWRGEPKVAGCREAAGPRGGPREVRMGTVTGVQARLSVVTSAVSEGSGLCSSRHV